MLRVGLSVSSPSAAQPSNPAQDRKAATTAAMTVEKLTPCSEKVLPSMPVLDAPPFAKITMLRIVMQTIPTPSMSSSSRVTTRRSMVFRYADKAMHTRIVQIHGTWNGCAGSFCAAAMNALRKLFTAATQQLANITYVPRIAKPEKKPARGPIVTPTNAYALPAWL